MITILQSKLGNKYPVADLSWLIGDASELDPVFAGRLAYLAKSKGIKLVIREGYRSTERQRELYRLYLIYKATGRGTVKSAAKPGTSWHEFKLAVDSSTQPFRNMSNAELKQYGLCKPISSEGWHFQPIETAGETDRRKWAPEEVEDDMTEAEVKKIIEESKTVYKTSNDIPDWGKAVIQKLISRGSIVPGAGGTINITHEMLRILVIMDREDA